MYLLMFLSYLINCQAEGILEILIFLGFLGVGCTGMLTQSLEYNFASVAHLRLPDFDNDYRPYHMKALCLTFLREPVGPV